MAAFGSVTKLFARTVTVRNGPGALELALRHRLSAAFAHIPGMVVSQSFRSFASAVNSAFLRQYLAG